MHFIFLVEDKSGEKMLELLLPRSIKFPNSFEVHSYKGVGHIPKTLKASSSSRKTTLLGKLPSLLKGFEVTFQYVEYAIFVVCDLDDNDLQDFKGELINLADRSISSPRKVCFCFAIEEMEAWLLGDIEAIRKAYPNAKMSVLNSYINDSICNTWELLADAVYKGGSKELKKKDYYSIGAEKISWATNICPYMDIDNNSSDSFNYLQGKISTFLNT